MIHNRIVASFTNERDILAAARELRSRDVIVLDAFTPYAVHGLDHAVGLKQSRLAWACFAGGLSGLSLMMWLQFWASSVSWPVNIGGKPWNSLPAFAPIAFESMVLLAGLSAFAALIVSCRLWPGKPAELPAAGTTEDMFALVIEANTAAFDPVQLRILLEELHAVSVEEIDE